MTFTNGIGRFEGNGTLVCDECGIGVISVKAERLAGIENDMRAFTTRMLTMNYGWRWEGEDKDLCPKCVKKKGVMSNQQGEPG